MSVERSALQIGGVALGASVANAWLRRGEETRRRRSSPYIHVVPDGHGRHVEAMVQASEDSDRPVVVLETGLGGSMDGWDWLAQGLLDDADLVRYYRRGHGRTTSRQRPGRLVLTVLQHARLTGRRVHLVGHSLGGLVIANAVHEFADLARQVSSVTLIDSTDADLLGRERKDVTEVRRFRQYCFQEGLAAATGLGRWTPSPVELEVNLRASAQKAFFTESSRVRTLASAVREQAHEPLTGQKTLASLDVPKRVIAASDNVVQQTRLARKLGAEIDVVPGSSHRSILGRAESARLVAARVKEALVP